MTRRRSCSVIALALLLALTASLAPGTLVPAGAQAKSAGEMRYFSCDARNAEGDRRLCPLHEQAPTALRRILAALDEDVTPAELATSRNDDAPLPDGPGSGASGFGGTLHEPAPRPHG